MVVPSASTGLEERFDSDTLFTGGDFREFRTCVRGGLTPLLTCWNADRTTSMASSLSEESDELGAAVLDAGVSVGGEATAAGGRRSFSIAGE